MTARSEMKRKMALDSEWAMRRIEELEAENERLRSPICEHSRYAESPNGKVRQCRDCFKCATLNENGWSWA